MRLRAFTELRALAMAAALLLAASPAAAFPVYFNGLAGFGVSGGTATSAESSGFSLIEAPIYQANFYDLVIPAPNVLSFSIKTSPTLANPTTAQSRWSVTNGDQSLDDAWLVFFTPVTYSFDKVGIDLQSGGRWSLAHAHANGVDYYYPAVFLGDVGADDTVTFLMNHVIGEKLTKTGNTYILPKYSVGLLQGIPVPEASTLALVAVGVALAGGLRRGKV